MPIETFIYASSKVALTFYPVVFYFVFEQDVSISKYGTGLKTESQLPYTMSKLFASSFAGSKRFLRDNVYLTAYAFFASGFVYWIFTLVWSTGGIMGADGKTFGLYTYGIVVPICYTVVHHA